jgi:hypothetical protein
MVAPVCIGHFQKNEGGMRVRTYLIEVVIWKHLARVPDLDACAVDQDANLVAICKHFGNEFCHVVCGA